MYFAYILANFSLGPSKKQHYINVYTNPSPSKSVEKILVDVIVWGMYEPKC